MIKIHSLVLMMCSVIGFTGHYLQFGVARLTPWIPATAGLLIFLVHYSYEKNKQRQWLYACLLIMILAFGILTTNMCIRFLPQAFQPLRKKIIFSVMSLSAWITIARLLKNRLGNPTQRVQ